MNKRTQYVVHVGNEVARFSDLRHACLFGIMISERMPTHLIEISVHAGLIGQYRNGRPTPEFEYRYTDGMFR